MHIYFLFCEDNNMLVEAHNMLNILDDKVSIQKNVSIKHKYCAMALHFNKKVLLFVDKIENAIKL